MASAPLVFLHHGPSRPLEGPLCVCVCVCVWIAMSSLMRTMPLHGAYQGPWREMRRELNHGWGSICAAATFTAGLPPHKMPPQESKPLGTRPV